MVGSHEKHHAGVARRGASCERTGNCGAPTARYLGKQSYGVKVTDFCKVMFVMAWCC